MLDGPRLADRGLAGEIQADNLEFVEGVLRAGIDCHQQVDGVLLIVDVAVHSSLYPKVSVAAESAKDAAEPGVDFFEVGDVVLFPARDLLKRLRLSRSDARKADRAQVVRRPFVHRYNDNNSIRVLSFFGHDLGEGDADAPARFVQRPDARVEQCPHHRLAIWHTDSDAGKSVG